ncbi:MAG: UbiH/UbiF/VisC/COQ6 family ubiquinone biosynthesis hydroxylase [Marinobacter sp.]|nr:UbiH/UbiF/VisC/COQ6 family ubiquinone biosynthesis hydroxylase [Marinobacter sp.]
MTPDRFDVIVAGGGLTGTALAVGLAQQGWHVALAEAASEARMADTPPMPSGVADYESRVSAISLASQRLLASLGVWQRLDPARLCPYTRMVVWDGDGTGRIEFGAADLQVPALGTIIENRLLVSALYHAAVEAGVSLIAGTPLTGWWESSGEQGVVVGADRRLSASLVVAADGPQSRLRQWVGLPTREWDYRQQAIVCSVQTRQPHQATAWQRFSTTGPLAFLPLYAGDRGDHVCSVVWSQDAREADRLMALDDAAFAHELEQAIEQQLGPVISVSARQAFPLRQRHAKQYVRAGFALVGDAAHSIHPLAGQGANLGYGDVRALLDELDRAHRRGVDPGDPVLLARYQRRRKGENLAMMAAMDGFKQLFGREELPLRWLRNTGLRWLDRAPLLKNRLAAQAMGLN